ncbi:hypothetical protein OIDMADRAFT_116151 [Oidiodendron maius Zn]|uniref:Protein kinase domain-containing protein n=1 Tax=Oidiodendron maius (strain Zn) TaxID=913774 RepID=A0A0C3D1S4_OIDMZ|nr:hypothetical protein OIDMADRAFT_116151 [Oidiodendron maius Zn]
MAPKEDRDPFDLTDEFSPPREYLSDRIVIKYEQSKFDSENKKFLPEGCINDLVTLEAIMKEIREVNMLEPEDLILREGTPKKKIVDFARGRGMKLFAISVVSSLCGNELVRAMSQFMVVDFSDKSLPVEEEEEDGSKDPFFRDTKSSPWSKTRIHVFCQEQWRFLAPVFTQHNFKVDLKAGHILPFIEKGTLVREGAFGQVFQVEIHPAHQEDPFPNPTVTAGLVKDIIEQLRGMAEALEKLHGYRGQYHYRHGDIKPQNILNFPDSNPARIGIFKISDLGSAKHHSVATRLRERTGDKAFATTQYQPPESITNKLSARSRLYDIWSMGCVILEFMVWLLYGYEQLQEFKARIKGTLEEPCSFFVIEQKDTAASLVAHIHPAVQACLVSMSEDPECMGDSALGDLLDIVKRRLLVVKLPQHSESFIGTTDSVSITNTDARSYANQPFGRHRSSAEGFRQALDDILKGKKASNEHYWFTGHRRDNMRLHRVLSDDWSYPVDNDFASSLLADMGTSVQPATGTRCSRLCSKCERMNFFVPRFRIEDTWQELESNRSTCDFCRMRWNISKHLNQTDYPSVSFERTDSVLRMNDDILPVLSICKSQGKHNLILTIERMLGLTTTTPIQIGFPQLSEAGSESHFKIMRQWLKNCDNNHQKFKCQPLGQPRKAFLPTRLIDVGYIESETIRLYETQPADSVKYIALSHPWGKNPPYFCTLRKNVEQHAKGIKTTDLTSTFKDAVQTTRQLGIQYLWIDSICIIQGPDGDFEQEAKHMEEIFSSAYCVLAASSAEGQTDGFLNKRAGRDFVTFEHDDQPPFYVCCFMDNFNQHVLQGPLNKRGWVMQERVMSHRTIYFTAKQTYWECGEGVRCETLTKMDNKLASFLGDPNFPEKITSRWTSRGERIYFYQNLYKQYSRLAFTRWEDRPIAIAGLERRLMYDLKTRGGFGIFDDGQSLLRRSLLWQRGSDETTLRKIVFPPERKITVPTWSWMAYQGGIDFLELPLGGVNWARGVNSLQVHGVSDIFHTIDQTGSIELRASVREFNIQSAGAAEFRIIYDIPKTEGQPLKCVVMGRGKEEGNPADARHYVLFITPKGGNVYERVGVGFMPGKFIELKASEHPRLVTIR